MKSISSLAILLIAVSALAQAPASAPTPVQQSISEKIKHFQIQPQYLVVSPSNQAGCPIVLTSAKLIRPAEYLPVTSEAREKARTHLYLSLSNPSGKQISSIGLTGYLKVKKDRYALDAIDVRMPLTFTPATGEIDTEANIPLLKDVVGFDRLTLDSVTYKDGSVWHAAQQRLSCSFTRGTEKVAK